MAQNTADTLAERLGIDTEAHLALVLAYANAHVGFMPPLDPLPHAAIINSLRSFWDVARPFFNDPSPENKSRSVMAHFTARYLPRLIEAFMAFPAGLRIMMPYGAMVCAVQIWLAPLLQRFLRVHEQQGRALLVAILEALEEAVLTDDEINQLDAGDGQVWSSLVDLAVHGLISSLPRPVTSPLFPWLAESSYFSSSFKMCEQALAPHFRVPTVKIGYLADLLSENALGVPKIRHTIIDCHNLNTLPGTGCEVLRKARQTMERAAFEKLKASCAKREEGKDLLLCSRCKSVRYCSVAHQSADWPTHKFACVEPRW